MSPHQRLCTAIVALAGASVLALGPTVVTAPAATAAPGGPAVTHVDSPFDGKGADDAPKKEKPNTDEPKKDERLERAEEVGGEVVSKAIDMSSGVVKCILHIATDAVQCKL
ncbi:hypothetical protein [Nocardia sp. NPDC050710]|uniref:hypothetical protein n=1 Tax=Nocardia sp. NPDC050710 TaxID=3157220 RepID=UPI0033ECC016